jgi:hypothetical protein
MEHFIRRIGDSQNTGVDKWAPEMAFASAKILSMDWHIWEQTAKIGISDTIY